MSHEFPISLYEYPIGKSLFCTWYMFLSNNFHRMANSKFVKPCGEQLKTYIRTSTYIAIGIPKMPSMAKQSKISHGKLFRILLSTCSWLKLCFVISQAYRTRPRTIKSMTCRIPYSVKCTSNEFITCFSRILNLRIHEIVSQNFAFQAAKCLFLNMINSYLYRYFSSG